MNKLCTPVDNRHAFRDDTRSQAYLNPPPHSGRTLPRGERPSTLQGLTPVGPVAILISVAVGIRKQEKNSCSLAS